MEGVIVVIKVYADVKPYFVRIVNQNINAVLDLFIESCKGIDYDTFIQEIFPLFLCRKDKDKCIEVVYDLFDYSTDQYEHILPPLYEYALFNLMEWWLDVTDEGILEREFEKHQIETQGEEYIAKHINNIAEYKSFLFEDWDFLDIPEFLQVYKSNPALVERFFHTDLDDYIELMPDDIRESYLSQKSEVTQKTNQESIIVKSIYNAVKKREMDPTRLLATSETQLSDDISQILSERLNEYRINVSREMPAGYAKKGIGEIDFYIYANENDTCKDIAIGENKEWGNFDKQVKQLLGYMNKDTRFGFTIIFNKKVKYNTVVEKRRELLKNFHVELNGEKHFEVQKIIELKSLPDVLVTYHQKPEDPKDSFMIFHFIANAYSPERRGSAQQARSK